MQPFGYLRPPGWEDERTRRDRGDQPRLASCGRASLRLSAGCLSAGLVLAAMLHGPASSAPRGEPKRVLMLHSFGRDFRPWSAYALRIKAELERQSQWPLELQEHTLLTARLNVAGPET